MTYDRNSPWVRCPDCGAKLRCSHAHREGTKRLTRHTCSKACGYVMVSFSQIVIEKPTRGQGFTNMTHSIDRWQVAKAAQGEVLGRGG